jgi:hypothetical protein
MPEISQDKPNVSQPRPKMIQRTQCGRDHALGNRFDLTESTITRSCQYSHVVVVVVVAVVVAIIIPEVLLLACNGMPGLLRGPFWRLKKRVARLHAEEGRQTRSQREKRVCMRER